MKLTKTLSELSVKSKERLRPTVAMFGESRTVQILSCVFVLQLFIAGGLLWKSNSQAQFAPATQLVSIDPSAVDEIIINDGDDSVSLLRTEDQWRLSDEHNTLAAVEKIDKLVADISGLKPGLPVASTRAAHQQLEVTEDSFQRHVTLKAGGEIVVDLYMGTSPGFRKSHVRPAGQEEVFAARLNTFDLPADHDDWLDKSLLSFNAISSIQTGDIELALENDQWSIASPEERSETHSVDKSGIDAVVSQLASLRVNGFAQPLEVLEVEESSEADLTEEATETAETEAATETEELLTHTLIVVQADSPVTLLLNKLGSDVTVERSDVPGVFSLPVAAYEALKPEVIQQLLVSKESEDEEPENQEEDSAPQG